MFNKAVVKFLENPVPVRRAFVFSLQPMLIGRLVLSILFWALLWNPDSCLQDQSLKYNLSCSNNIDVLEIDTVRHSNPEKVAR